MPSAASAARPRPRRPPVPTQPENPLNLPVQKLTLGCLVLDRLLRGGLPVGSVTELVSESGAGKTQLCLQLLLAILRFRHNPRTRSIFPPAAAAPSRRFFLARRTFWQFCRQARPRRPVPHPPRKVLEALEVEQHTVRVTEGIPGRSLTSSSSPPRSSPGTGRVS